MMRTGGRMPLGVMENPTSPARTFVGAAAPASASVVVPLQKVEYLAHNIEEGVELIALFNNIGEEGWVLCTIDNGTAWFARPKRGNAPAPQHAPAPTGDAGPTIEKS